MSHDSLLILTWDEDDDSQGNHIATIVVGSGCSRPRCRAGQPLPLPGHHRGRLRLPRDGRAAGTTPITNIWLP